MRIVLLCCLVGCAGPDADPSDVTDDPVDPYAGIEPSDAIQPLGALIGGRVIHLMDVSTDGQTAWVSAYAGGYPVDVRDPASPLRLDAPLGRRLYGVDVDADRVLFSGRESGVLLAGRGDGEALQRIARRVDDVEAPERAVLLGDHVVIAAQTGGLIVARAADLEEVARVTDAVPNAFAVAASGSLVAVGDRERGLVLLDLSDPTNPVERGALALRGAPQDLDFVGDVVWAASGSVIEAVDVSSPDAPVLRSTTATLGVATRLDASGDLLAVAAWEDTRLYDVSDPDAPVLIATEGADSSATSVAIHDDLLVVGDWDDLRTYRIDASARSAELRAEDNILVTGLGSATAELRIQNEGNLPLDLGRLSCEDERLTPIFEPEQLLPAEATELEVGVDLGTGAPFEGRCTVTSSDVDEPAHSFLIRANPAGLSVGDLAPDFTLPDLDGTFHSLSDTRGKVVLISIFSSI